MNKIKEYLKFILIFLKIGFFTIGGGLAMIPLMEKEFVDQNKFVTKEEFLDIISLSQSVPGVISINVSVFIGRKIHGFLGSVLATIGLILPSFISIIVIIPIFSMIKDAWVTQKVLKGILSAAAAMILLSVINMFKISVVNIKTGIICAVSFVLIVFFSISVIYIILASGILGVTIYLLKGALKMLIKFISLFTIFFKIGIFGFGGGYVMLPLIYQEIERLHIMGITQFNQLVSLSQITPGPIMVNAATYVGYIYSGFLGAVIATFAVAIPSFIYMYLIYIFLEKFKGSLMINAFLTGVRPATVGLLAAAVVYFLQGSVFDKTIIFQLFSKPMQVVSLPAFGIFILSILLAKKLKFSPITIFIIAGILGAMIL